ncbi:MAG TPA: peroxidase-related enzyme [Candidatus Sulfotelmatobacter sp.]|nr:peroxidase-related enzyme [Candidatus Sulfotelmatobacter sp.]
MSAPRFTADALDWDAWIETVTLDDATPEQIAVLEKSLPTAKTSPYYLLLVHDVEALSQRSSLFNAVMYGPRGLPRAERELATVAVSLINGCPYCVSVHARRFVELTKEREVMGRLLEEGPGTELDARRRAIVDFSATLTRAPERLTAADLAPLRAVGLSDLEILDLVHAAAMFAWANRLMQTLGEPVAPTKTG